MLKRLSLENLSLGARIVWIVILSVFITAFLVFLPSFYFMKKTLTKEFEEKASNAAETILSAKEVAKQEVRVYAEILSKKESLIEAVSRKDINALEAILVPAFKSIHEEDELIRTLEVTDDKGIVLMRGHNPAKRGDDKSGVYMVKTALEGHAIAGIEVSPTTGEMAYDAVYPLIKDGRVVGTIKVGAYFKKEFAEYLKKISGVEVILFSGSKVNYSTFKEGETLTLREEIKSKLNPKSAFHEDLKIGKEEYRLFYIPTISPTGEVKGAIAGAISYAPLKSALLNLTLALLMVAFLISLLLGFLFSIPVRKWGKTLKECAHVVKNYSMGNFQVKIPEYKFNDEIKEILKSLDGFNSFKRVMDGLIHGINQSAQTIAKITTKEKERVEEITPLTSQLNSLVEKAGLVGSELTEFLTSIESSTEEMKMAISEISKNTHETADRGELVREAAMEMEETVLNLSRSMEDIRNIAETIKGIAEQTNLLALNASIEAARAGEAGRGFAVVANEVKELAQKVSEFTGEIEKIINHLNKEVSATVEKAGQTKQMVDEVENATQMIAGAVEKQTAVTSTIIDNVMQTKEKSFSLVYEIEDLGKVVKGLLEVSEVLKAGTDILSEIALTNQIAGNLFRLEGKTLSVDELNDLDVGSLVNLGIIEHMNWKIDFLAGLSAGEVPKVQRNHKKCLLGLSMAILRERLKGTHGESILNALDEPHKRLHGLVERVEREVDLKDRSAIIEFIRKEVLPTFEEVMKGLLDLKEFSESMER